MANIPSGITPEMLEEAINNPGEVISNNQATKHTPATSIDISPASKGLRPQIGGQVAGDERISGPSKNFALKLATADEQRIKEEKKRQEEREKESHALNPQTLRRDIEALRREVKRLAKSIKEQQT